MPINHDPPQAKHPQTQTLSLSRVVLQDPRCLLRVSVHEKGRPQKPTQAALHGAFGVHGVLPRAAFEGSRQLLSFFCVWGEASDLLPEPQASLEVDVYVLEVNRKT